MTKKWTIEDVQRTMENHTNPSTLDGFLRKDYISKGADDLSVRPGEREFIAKITTNVRDRDAEIINPAGINFKTFLANPIILWAHNYMDMPIGKAVWIKKWSEGRMPLGHISKGRLAKDIQKVDEILSLMQQGILKTVSIGFMPIESHEPTKEDIEAYKKRGMDLRGVRRIHDKIVMLEYSIVNVPANPEATIEAVSKGILEISPEMQQDLNIYQDPIVIPPDIKKAVPYAETPLDGIESGWSLRAETSIASLEDLAIMAAWIDNENKELLSSYKYIHHRSSSGHPAVFEGVAQAMSKLQTRALNTPEYDRHDVYVHLARHYKDFGVKPPEFIEKPEKFEMPTIAESSVVAQDVIEAHKPIPMKTLDAQKIIEVKRVLDLQKIKKDALESFEINVLGKV